MHKKKNPNYKKYFRAFTLDSFLKLLSIKRNAYTYEQELRLFVIPQNSSIARNRAKHAQFMDIQINWKDIITKVRIDKKCSDAELVSIQRACFSVGINPKISNYTFVGGMVPPLGLKDIDFVRFDIDDMPGTSVITIK